MGVCCSAGGMGRPVGSRNGHGYKKLTAVECAQLLARNADAFATGQMRTQQMLAEEFGVSQGTVGRVLRMYGARIRTRTEASPTTIPVDEAARIYLANPRMTIREIAALFGRSFSALQAQFNRAGIVRRSSKDYLKYSQCDRQFFSEVDPVRAYFAGFIAADGYITVKANAVVLGIHPKDRSVLESLQKAATLDQPIVERPNNKGNLYNWLSVCSPEWVRDLRQQYNIVNRKSLILQPPPFEEPSLVWAYIRGYFDGDGHAGKSGTIAFTCGSPVFLQWLRAWLHTDCGDPGHVQTHLWETEDGVEYVTAQSLFYSKRDVSGRIARKMYEHSTPATRLARKYLRLRKHLEDWVLSD